ncbi:MAG TPA: hypothetical protein VJA47_02225 [archaeon]|nr:hypothetical protein [archaeon]
MLKVLPIILVAILILLSGCISNEEPAKTPTETAKPKTSVDLDRENLSVTHIAAVEGTYKKIQIDGTKITFAYTTKSSNCKDWLKADCSDEKRKEAEITEKELDNLTATIMATDFFGLKGFYGGEEAAPGFPSYSIEVRSGTNQKKVTFNVAFNSEEKIPPKDFSDIESVLLKLVIKYSKEIGDYGNPE